MRLADQAMLLVIAEHLDGRLNLITTHPPCCNGLPSSQYVLHVSCWLEDSGGQARLEQALLDAEFVPVVRHGLGLGMQNRMIDEVLHASSASSGNHPITNCDFIRTHIRANVINRLCVPHRPPQGYLVAHITA